MVFFLKAGILAQIKTLAIKRIKNIGCFPKKLRI